MKSNSTRVKSPLLLLLFLLLFTTTSTVYSQVLLSSSFEGSNPWSGFNNNQSCCSYSVTQSTAHAHDGNTSFRSEVRVGDPSVSAGWRAELTASNVNDQGDMWYGFSCYFETPVNGAYWTGSYGGHFIQWHPNNGSGSAELAIYGSEGKWDVTVNPSGGPGGTHQTTTASGGSLKKITANVWHDVVFHVNWASSGGMVEVWIDGELYFTKSNLSWAPNPYLKFGMNRWGNCNNGAPCDTWVIYYDNIKIGRNVTYADVAPTSSTTPPVNQPPVVDAGSNINIALPTANATLRGSATDADGTVASYSWSRVSGPSTFTLATPLAAVTNLTSLIQGTYVFRLTATDNDGATSSDDVTVTVSPPVNLPPTANAGNNITLTLPTNSTTLNGSGADIDGTIASYAWTRVSGPATYTLGAPNAGSTTLSGLVAGTYVFRLTVTDNAGATATDNVTVTVNPAPNQSPSVSAGNDITITLPTNSTTLHGTASDDGTISSYAWTRVSGPATYTLGTPNAATTTLNGLVQGVYVFRLTATDDDGATGTDNITVTVNPNPNQAPVANAGTNITITLPTNSTVLNGNGSSDADGTISTYAWTRVSGPAAYTLGTANAASATLGNLVQGVYVFRLTVTDNDGATDTDDITVTVNAAPNQAPVANAGTDITITLPTNSTVLNGNGSSDPDGTISTYAWSRVSGPATYNLGSANAAATVLGNLVQGVYVFRLTVTDNSGATNTDNVTVTVNAAPTPNQAPVANAGNNITITLPTNSTALNGTGTDADGTVASYAWSWVSGPAAYTIVNGNNATATVNGLAQGVYTFKLTVTDNDGATAIDLVTVTVNAAPPPNQLPIARAGSNITITLPTNTTVLDGNGSYDPDGTISTYAWALVSGPATYTLANANAAATVLNNLVQGVYTFRLTVTDNRGGTGIDDVIVTVNPAPLPPNQLPVANAGNDIVMTLPTNSTTLNGSASTDADGIISTYSWVRISGPANYTFANGNAATTALSNLVQGIYVFRLTVTDNRGGTDTDDITVTVNPAPLPANQPPVANAGDDIILILPENATDVSGVRSTDPDGVIAGYEWSQLSGPSQLSLTSRNGAALHLEGLMLGEYTFELKVTDNRGGTSKASVRVIVKNRNGEDLFCNIYPNPVSSRLNISYNGNNTGKVRINVYNANKQHLMSELATKSQVTMNESIDVSRFRSGTYFLEIILSGNKKIVKKFVIK